jgi:hypothetical protein
MKLSGLQVVFKFLRGHVLAVMSSAPESKLLRRSPSFCVAQQAPERVIGIGPTTFSLRR